jgi:hypothetical protein
MEERLLRWFGGLRHTPEGDSLRLNIRRELKVDLEAREALWREYVEHLSVVYQHSANCIVLDADVQKGRQLRGGAGAGEKKNT